MRINKSLITYIPTSGAGSGTVTSVAMSVPTGFVVTGSPITSSGTLAVTFASGYSLPTDARQATWDAKMNNPLTTLGDTLYSNASGAALRLPGNTTATQKFLSQTGDGFGNSAAPSWQEISAISIGAVPSSRTLTINGTAYDLSANRSWSVGTVTSVALTTTTSGISISGSPVTSSGNLNIEISTASGSANGLLSSSDWTSFNSRMSNPMTSLGDIIYANAAGAPLRRAGNTTTTKMFLSQTGDGTSSAAPQWSAVTASDTGAVPTSRTLTINDVAFDLSANRSWSVGDYGTW